MLHDGPTSAADTLQAGKLGHLRDFTSPDLWSIHPASTLRDRLRAREALQRAHDDLERKVEERTRTLRAAQDELVHAGVRFIVEPHVRFKGEVGEQSTMFFLDPSGNALEFKAFADDGAVFAT